MVPPKSSIQEIAPQCAKSFLFLFFDRFVIDCFVPPEDENLRQVTSHKKGPEQVLDTEAVGEKNI